LENFINSDHVVISTCVFSGILIHNTQLQGARVCISQSQIGLCLHTLFPLYLPGQ
jgi:hypothetical protein